MIRSFTRDGLVFDVRDTGGGAGQLPVVCLHGFPQDGSAYDAVVPLLTAQGLRVLVPDQRGYSPGARPAGRRPYVLRELVADVVALLDQVGTERAHVVGHDWGGAVAWALAGRSPDRVASLTVLSTPHPAAMTHRLVRSGQALRSSYMGVFQLPRVPEALLLGRDAALLRELLRRSGLREGQVEHYARRMLEPGALSAALAWYRALLVPPTGSGGGSGGGGPGGPGRPGDRRVPVPTTYLWGRHDPAFAPGSVRRTGEHVSGPFSSEGLRAGHWLPETRPQDVARAVLDRIASS